MAKMAKELRAIPVNDINANREQPRKTFSDESLSELAESIKAVGIIQPLTVRESSNGKYMLISGERRLRASKLAGLKNVPCVILKGEASDLDMMSLIENIQREDLNYIEEALAYRSLIEKYNLTQQQLAEKVGKKQSTVANKLRLLKLGDEVIKRALAAGLSERHSRVLLQIPDTAIRLKAIEAIVKRSMNVKQAEDYVEKLKAKSLLKETRDNVRTYFNYKIYTNTLKQAYDSILKTGIDAEYDEVRYEDKVEVVITIPIDK